MSASFRRNLRVSHDARGFLIASRGLAGQDCRYDLRAPAGVTSEKFRQWVGEGIFLPFPMESKQGGTRLRVLLDEALSAEEEEDWVDQVAWKLRVPDGQLALIGGGYDYLNGERDRYAAFLPVPPDDYRVEVYTCFCGVNGPTLYEEMRDPRQVPMPVGAWFRQTRPGEGFPGWLLLHCYEDPEADPDHEVEYHDDVFDYDAVDEAVGSLVDFIVRLRPLPGAEPLPDAPPTDESGWFPIEVNRRVPEKCPRGLQMASS